MYNTSAILHKEYGRKVPCELTDVTRDRNNYVYVYYDELVEQHFACLLCLSTTSKATQSACLSLVSSSSYSYSSMPCPWIGLSLMMLCATVLKNIFVNDNSNVSVAYWTGLQYLANCRPICRPTVSAAGCSAKTCSGRLRQSSRMEDS